MRVAHARSPRQASALLPVQIVAGILLKYVNLGAGWRHRLFVLQDGVIRYYKVGGSKRKGELRGPHLSRSNVQTVMYTALPAARGCGNTSGCPAR